MKSKINFNGNSSPFISVQTFVPSGNQKRVFRKPLFFGGILPMILLASQVFVSTTAASADEVQLQQQQATMDTSKPAAPPEKTMLNGQVSRDDSGGTTVSTINQGDGKVIINIQSANGPVRISGDRLQAILNAVSKLRTPEFNGVSQHARTADDFRALQYGVIGMVSTQMWGERPVVTRIFPTSPAAFAGIQAGDIVIKANDHTFRGGDGPMEFWHQIAGKANTPVDVTIMREKQTLTFHMLRMNIEDIKDDAVRRQYERTLGLFGPPTGEGSKAVKLAHHHSHRMNVTGSEASEGSNKDDADMPATNSSAPASYDANSDPDFDIQKIFDKTGTR